jgi:hypothetical protein
VQLIQRYRTPSDLPPRMPVFPLRGCILLPRTSLPLNIFEPRYLSMLDDVIRGDRIIGIIQPIGDEGETGSPRDRSASLHSVGCTGRVVAFQELDDGRLVITLTGIIRFELGREADVATPYRMFSVDYRRFATDLDRAMGDEEAVDRDRLLDALRRYLDARDLEADWSAFARSSSEQLINSLSVAGPFGSEEKQALLEARDLKTRAETLIALAEMEIATGGGTPGTTLQ